MITTLRDNFLRFVFLVFIQVLILNNIQFSSFLNSYIYVLFILLLPFETPKWLLLLLGFLTGLTMDLFSDTMGMHAAATTFMAFGRPGILRIISSRQDYEPGMRPTVKDLGIRWFVTYSLVMISIHHISLFFIETFRLSEILPTLLRSFVSISFTLFLVILSQYLFVKSKE